MKDVVFRKEYEVKSYDTNTSGNLSLKSLFSYLQDIAGAHASVLHFGRDDLLKEKRFWVLSRIICRIEKIPLWNDIITIETWPKGIEGVFAIRKFRILNSDGDAIGEASSSWIILDSGSRRPVRPGENLAQYSTNSPAEGFSCPTAGKVNTTTQDAYRSPLRKVRYSDLDINMHVNNANYISWVLDSYPLDFLQDNIPVEVEVNYLSEATAGDEYIVTAEQLDESFNHSVIKENGQKEACRVRIKWKPCDENKV